MVFGKVVNRVVLKKKDVYGRMPISMRALNDVLYMIHRKFHSKKIKFSKSILRDRAEIVKRAERELGMDVFMIRTVRDRHSKTKNLLFEFQTPVDAEFRAELDEIIKRRESQ